MIDAPNVGYPKVVKVTSIDGDFILGVRLKIEICKYIISAL